MPTDTSAHDKMAAVYADEAAFACQEWAKNAASTINRDQRTARHTLLVHFLVDIEEEEASQQLTE